MIRSAKTEHFGSNEPATKGDLENLREDLHADMVEMGDSIKGELRAEMRDTGDNIKGELRKEMREMEKRIVFEFKAVTESFYKDIAAVTRDEISGVKDRVTAIEKRVGLPAN